MTPPVTQVSRDQLDRLAIQYAEPVGIIPGDPDDTAAWREYRTARQAAVDRARDMLLADDGWLGGPYELVDDEEGRAS